MKINDVKFAVRFFIVGLLPLSSNRQGPTTGEPKRQDTNLVSCLFVILAGCFVIVSSRATFFKTKFQSFSLTRSWWPSSVANRINNKPNTQERTNEPTNERTNKDMGVLGYGAGNRSSQSLNRFFLKKQSLEVTE